MSERWQETGLPGGELVDAGLADLAAGVDSVAAALVRGAGPRLTALGIDIPPSASNVPATHRLYELLASEAADPYGRYNALLARIASFADAAESRATGS